MGDNFKADGGGSVREITKDASHVFEGRSKRAVKQRLHYFKKKWQSRQSKSVSSLLSDFDLTLSYFDAGIDALQFARTTVNVRPDVHHPWSGHVHHLECS